ncbi:MAG: ATP-dependent DNA helicase RecG [Elusimicrobiota bacterium]|jgi:ATP-dependent DNA helicase RecG
MISPPAQALANSVQYLKGIGPKRAELFARLGIQTLGDLLDYLPRAWEDRRPTDPSRPILEGAVALRGRVTHAREMRTGARLLLYIARLRVPGYPEDIECSWFKRPNRRYDAFATLKKEVVQGADLWIVGSTEPSFLRIGKVQVHEYYRIDDPHAGLHVDRLVPIYPLTEGLSNRLMREAVASALEETSSELREYIPRELLEKRELLALPQAVPAIHFPRSAAELEEGRRRLAYEELLLLELAWLIKRRQMRGIGKDYGYEVRRTLLTPMKDQLGFEFTHAQKRAINEIFDDLRAPRPMTRLLQGDVGSGKTVVALSALLLAVENGYQGAFMAPTEILAEQHFWTIRRFLKDLPVGVEVLSSRVGAARRKKILAGLSSGDISLVVGTHSLLEGGVSIPKLKLAVIDEQHRFGVRQRATLRQKGPSIDLLLMTATPIPRTLSLALYGDLDVSTLDEMPPGRRYPTTRHVPEQEALEAARREALAGRQVYVVYPIIEESNTLELKAAIAEYERLRAGVFQGLRTTIVHGRMPGAQKVRTMEEFSQGRWDVLVATPVIEVGVDVPNATVMIIQNAERFGLASLHQLRGRIGRGTEKSYCFLVADPMTPEARRRVATLCETNDGFRISEEDLQLRGPGAALGVEQHGDLCLRAADLKKDAALLTDARADASALLDEDPSLRRKELAQLRSRLRARYERKWHSIDLA